MKTSFWGDRAYYRAIVSIGLPIALQNLFSTCASMVDTIMIGSLVIGTHEDIAVAAVGVAGQFSSLMFASYYGFASGGTMFFSQYWGAKDEKGICKAYGITFSLMLLIGFIFMGMAVFAPMKVMGIYTDASKIQIREVGAMYLRIVGFSYPIQVIAMAMSFLLRSTERIKAPVVASIVSVLSNVLLNWVLIYGHLGMPAMGVEGAAVATVIASFINVAIIVGYSVRDKNSFITRFSEQFGWSRAFIAEYLKKCSPIIANEMLYGIGQMLINRVLGHQSAAGIAAIAVFRSVEGFVFAFFGGFASSNSVIIGKAVGAGQLERAYGDAKRMAWQCPLMTLLICLLVVLFRPLILQPFALSQEAHNYLMNMFLIYMAGATLRTANYIMNNTYRAGGEPVVGAALELGALFVFSVPLVSIAGFVLKLPFLAVFAAMYIEEAAKLGIALWYLRSGRWIRPVTQIGKKQMEAFTIALKTKKA